MSNTDMSTAEKPWYASKTILASIVSMLAIGASALFGLKWDAATQAYLVDQAVAVSTGVSVVVASAIAIYGRVKATKAIA